MGPEPEDGQDEGALLTTSTLKQRTPTTTDLLCEIAAGAIVPRDIAVSEAFLCSAAMGRRSLNMFLCIVDEVCLYVTPERFAPFLYQLISAPKNQNTAPRTWQKLYS